MWSVNTPGVYLVTANWFDGGVPNYYTGEMASTSFILHLWIPETTYIVAPLMQPGHIYQQGTLVDNTTFYEPIHSGSYTLSEWLNYSNISASGGSDADTKRIYTYLENGQQILSTSTCSNTVNNIPPQDNISFSQPGIYTLTWTFQDSSTGAQYFVDDPDATRSITLVLWHYKAGPSPTGGRIFSPSSTWHNSDPYRYDYQAVVNTTTTSPTSSVATTISCYADWTTGYAWQDIDEKWIPLAGGGEYCADTVPDDPLGTGFWWEDTGDGSFSARNEKGTIWYAGNTPDDITIKLYLRDAGNYANDTDTPATGTPNTYPVTVYDSHLERDRTNFIGKENWPLRMYDIYGVHSSSWNCHSATHHAYSGDSGGQSLQTLYFLNYPNFSTDSNQYLYDYDFSKVSLGKGDVVVFFTAADGISHCVTAVGDGSEIVYQANYPGASGGYFYECTITDIFIIHEHSIYHHARVYHKN